MSNARFSILQARAVKDRRVSDAQFRTLAALGCYGDQNGWCFPSLKTLGKDLGKSFQAVGVDIHALVELEYLEKHHRFNKNGGQRSNLYRLKFDTPSTPEVEPPSSPEIEAPSTPEVEHNDPPNEPKKNVKQAAPPKPETPPEIKVYREVSKKFPNSANIDEVVKAVQSITARLGREATPADLRPFYHEWTARGYNQFSIKWLTDWASIGIIPAKNGNGNKHVEPKAFEGVRKFLQAHGVNDGKS